MNTRTFHNPVYHGYLADPFCFRHEGVYYAIGTGRTEADMCATTGRVVPMIKSRDLEHWQSVGHILEQPAEERGGAYWAPEIAHDGHRFYLYYSPGNLQRGFHIRCAVADTPEGPYGDIGKPLTQLEKTHRFAIDGHAFRDDDGQWYLYYATDFLDYNDRTFRGTALVVDRMTSMTTLEGNPTTVMRAHWSWQLFQRNRLMHGIAADWYTLEGPTVVKRHGTYYLLYSGGCYQNDTYGVDYLTADHPLGPWQEHGKNRGPQVIRTIPGKVLGPGHNSIVTDESARDYIIYHAWNSDFTARQLWIDPLEFHAGLPRVEPFADHIANTPVHEPRKS